jgi:hypothetical protein
MLNFLSLETVPDSVYLYVLGVGKQLAGGAGGGQ